MALSRKNSRRITIDRQVYRWAVSQDSGYVVVVAQLEAGNGQRVEIVVSKDEGLVIEKGSFGVEYGGIAELIVTPKTVETLIQRAISNGWKPETKASPLELTLKGHELIVRRGL